MIFNIIIFSLQHFNLLNIKYDLNKRSIILFNNKYFKTVIKE